MRTLPAETIRARASRRHHPVKTTAGLRLRCPPLLLAMAAGLSCIAAGACAQTVPVQTASPLYTPFSIPTVNGTLHYSITGSEATTFGYNGGGGTDTSGSFSGNLGFVAPSVLRPFSIVYSGGFSLNSLGQSSQFYQNVSLTQGFNTARWNFSLSDTMSFLPQTASTGLSGIPGAGDLGVSTGTDTTQEIITPAATHISNTVTGSVGRNLTGRTSLSGNASYSIQRFLNDPGAIETDSLGVGGSLSHRLDARSSIAGSYRYNQFSYVAQSGAFTSQGATFTYSRRLTRRLNLSLGAGPEFVGGSVGRTSTLTYSANVRATYTGAGVAGASLSGGYVRSVNSGSGTGLGATTDTWNVTGTRRVTRSLSPSAQISFTRTIGLAGMGSPALDTHTFVASTQANRAIGRVTSVYVSYTAEHQTYSGSFQGLNPVSGVIQTLAFGVTYSPRSIHVGRQ